MSEFIFMQGDEACGMGAIKAGCRFFAGYPITPATDIAEYMSRELPKVGGKFMQMEDEISSISAVIGASLAGAKAMTATSGPGFSLMQEGIGYASMTETPCVIVDVQRGGPSTGLPTKPSQGDVMQARWGTHGDHPVIVIYPSTVGEVYRYIITAFNYAERYRTPVIFLMDEVLGHMRETFVLPDDNEIYIQPRIETKVKDEDIYHPYLPNEEGILPMERFGSEHRFHVSGLVHDESGFPVPSEETAKRLLRRLHDKIKRNEEDIILWDEEKCEDAEILLIAYGVTARSAMAALKEARDRKVKIGLFKPITLWPFPIHRLRELLCKVNTVIVPELNMGQILYDVARANRGRSEIIPLNKVNGDLITPEEILEAIYLAVKENEEL